MNVQERDDFAVLVADYEAKSDKFQACGWRGVHSSASDQEVAEARKNYHLAEAEMFAAMKRLLAAKQLIGLN